MEKHNSAMERAKMIPKRMLISCRRYMSAQSIVESRGQDAGDFSKLFFKGEK